MTGSMLYETIFKRKSIRKYEQTALPGEVQKSILDRIGRLKPLFGNIKVEFKLVPGSRVKSLVPIKAPHYLAVFSEQKEGYRENAGFMTQQMDLFLSSTGVGTCWLGMAKPAREILEQSSLSYVISLAFGPPREPLHRAGPAEFKRKSLEQITDMEGAKQLLEAVLLAPSAVNGQPWYFSGAGDLIHCYRIKHGFIKSALYDDLNRIDMGIALCHLWLAALHAGQDFEVFQDESGQPGAPAGYHYVTTVRSG